MHEFIRVIWLVNICFGQSAKLWYILVLMYEHLEINFNKVVCVSFLSEVKLRVALKVWEKIIALIKLDHIKF